MIESEVTNVEFDLTFDDLQTTKLYVSESGHIWRVYDCYCELYLCVLDLNDDCGYNRDEMIDERFQEFTGKLTISNKATK